jgi:hypothetical protein
MQSVPVATKPYYCCKSIINDRLQVALEFLVVSEQEMALTGTVCVSNITFQKRVIIRYSLDHWVSKGDVRLAL